jgi:regulator of sirC expression with transglutaminase-like and TPR domain
MLVGKRIGLNIEGCNFPGHFLTVASSQRQKILVDCFNGGAVIDAESLRSVGATISFSEVLRLQCDARAIMARVLRNLGNAYEQAGEAENAATMYELLIQTELAA